MSFTRRHFLGSAAAPLFAGPMLAKKEKEKPEQPPSILLILADDLAAWMTGIYGNKEIKTPGIDLLARQGIRFSNHLVCTPSDSPSRATLFTGRTPMQHGIQDFLTPHPIAEPPQGQAAPPPSFAQEIMISDLLAGRGYNCGYTGKWHMGADERPQHGFKFWYTMPGGPDSYQDPVMSWNGQTVNEKGYLADLITKKAIEFLDSQKPDHPFFLVASYLNPHTPYDGHPKKYYDLYENANFDAIGWQPAAENASRDRNYLKDIVANIRKCAAATSALDDQITPLVNALNQRTLRDNTMIVLTSGNGFLLGRHGLWSAGLASYPVNMYEEVMETPMIWSWLGKTPVEAVRPEVVSAYDFFPTLCDLTGTPPPNGRNLCGRSYLPFVLGRPFPKKDPWRNVAFGHFHDTEMCHDSRFKLIQRKNGVGPNELYNLSRDPHEQVNHSDDPQFMT
ncbi:MAG: sulfatase family protein, partial [Bryobacteraceae bacterium]